MLLNTKIDYTIKEESKMRQWNSKYNKRNKNKHIKSCHQFTRCPGPPGLQFTGLTGSCLPQRVEVSHEDGVIHLSEEPLQDIRHILDEVVPDPQFDVSSIFAKLFHQEFDSGFGPVLPVDALMAQTYRACSERHFI